MSLTVRIALALVAVWVLAGAGIFWLKQATPTAENVARLMEDAPLEGRSDAQRRRAIEKVTERLNGLEYEERQKLRRTRAPRDFYAAMTDPERLFFLEQTLPAGFRQMMDAFNKMEPSRRQRMVKRVLDDMEQDEDVPSPSMDDVMTQQIVDQGLRAFYNDASAETKLDLAPLIERMQVRMQRLD